MMRRYIGSLAILLWAIMLFCRTASAQMMNVTAAEKAGLRKMGDQMIPQTEKYFTFERSGTDYVIKYVSYQDPKTDTYRDDGLLITVAPPLGWSMDVYGIPGIRNGKPEIKVFPGGVDFIWTSDKVGRLRLRFVGITSSPFLYVQCLLEQADGGLSAQSVRVILNTQPGHFLKPWERYIKTGSRELAAPKEAGKAAPEIVLSEDEKYVACLDRYWDSADRNNLAIAGLVCDTSSFKEVRMTVGMYTVACSIKPGKGEACFALLAEKGMKNDDFVAVLSQETPACLANLASPDFFQVQEKIRILPPD